MTLKTSEEIKIYVFFGVIVQCFAIPVTAYLAWKGITEIWKTSSVGKLKRTRSPSASSARTRSQSNAARGSDHYGMSLMNWLAIGLLVNLAVNTLFNSLDFLIRLPVMRGYKRSAIYHFCQINLFFRSATFMTAQSLIVMFLFERLVVTFEDSSSELVVAARTRKWLHRVMAVWTVLMWFAMVLSVWVSEEIGPVKAMDWNIYRAVNDKMTSCQRQHNKAIGRIATVLFVIFSVAFMYPLYGYLGYAFVSRLGKVFNRQHSMSVHEPEAEDDAMWETQVALVKKVSVTSLLSVLTSVLVFCIYMAVPAFSVTQIDMLINCFCIICNYRFATSWYAATLKPFEYFLDCFVQ